MCSNGHGSDGISLADDLLLRGGHQDAGEAVQNGLSHWKREQAGGAGCDTSCLPQVQSHQQLRLAKKFYTLSTSHFCRYDADCLLKNIFEIFESQNAGRVSNNEILWVFSMSMSGTGRTEHQSRVFHSVFHVVTMSNFSLNRLMS